MSVLSTPYGERLNPARPLQEYPRPQMVRNSYLCLNGPWQYTVTKETGFPALWEGNIVVPFAPESALSGVNRVLQPDEYLWYKREVTLPEGFVQSRTLLHFGGVDQCCVVYINGVEVGRHDGAFLPFMLDITKHLLGDAVEIALMVIDETDTAPYVRGRQKLEHGGEWHTPQSGIWQTVWLESVPKNYIKSLRITPLFDASAVEIMVTAAEGPLSGRIEVFARSSLATSGTFVAGIPVRLQLPGALSWTPGHPFLYTVLVTAREDKVASYFGMRKIELQRDEKGNACLMLNNRKLLVSGILDPGMFSDSLYTPPSDSAMIADIQYAKRCGFNALRKYAKIEPLRWYYHCDRLGMLVWQDLPGGGGEPKRGFSDLLFSNKRNRKDSAYARFGRESVEGRQSFLRDMDGAAALLYNTPSLAVWVLFHEGYGQFDAAKAAQRMKQNDPTRLVDHASGWYDQGAGDFISLHNPGKPPMMPEQQDERIVAMTSIGGFGIEPAEHFGGKTPVAPGRALSPGHFADLVSDLYTQQLPPLVAQGAGVFFYTQLSDWEDEASGLLSFDRRIEKLKPSFMYKLNAGLQKGIK